MVGLHALPLLGETTPVEREAARLLCEIVAGLDVTPRPDGRVDFRFSGDLGLLDGLAVWSAARVDDEDDELGDDEGDERQADADFEDCQRTLPRPTVAELRELLARSFGGSAVKST